MNNKFKGGVVALAATGLLVGGSTFALWSDSADVDGATITSGKLGLTTGNVGQFDISADRTDAALIPGTGGLEGHAVNFATWKTVPGDDALYKFDVTGTLEGDNMVAGLTMVDATSNAALVNGEGYTVTYTVIDTATGAEVMSSRANATEVKFRSADNTNADAATLPVMDATGSKKYTVLAKVHFEATETNLQGAPLNLDAVSPALTQARTAGAAAPGTAANGVGGFKG